MAWNPSPEVAIARDAAKRLGDADQCIVIFLNYRTNKIGMASYGRTKELCADAKELGTIAFEAINDCLKD
jgi:hypothetical protein